MHMNKKSITAVAALLLLAGALMWGLHLTADGIIADRMEHPAVETATPPPSFEDELVQ